MGINYLQTDNNYLQMDLTCLRMGITCLQMDLDCLRMDNNIVQMDYDCLQMGYNCLRPTSFRLLLRLRTGRRLNDRVQGEGLILMTRSYGRRYV
jgi:hypothetical protein